MPRRSIPIASSGPRRTRTLGSRSAAGSDGARHRNGVRVTESVVDVGRGIRLCCDTIGDPGDPPMVLIPGLGQQFHSWPQEFAETLASRGFLVTRIDNRDVGRSTHMSFPAPKPWAIVRGGSDPRQYHLGDMARDTVGVLGALGYRDAHLVGISMG